MGKLGKILIIDDEEKIRTLLSRIVGLEGFEVEQAADLKSALFRLEHTDLDVVICDVKLPDGNGVDFLKTIKERFPVVEVILLTAYGNIPDGVLAIKNGAFDYLTKGDDNNRIIPLLYRAIEKVELAKRITQLERQLEQRLSFDRIIGSSQLLQQAVNSARKVAITDATVLLTGETGTGKEVFAQAIHQESSRRGQNFVAVNCAAFSKDILENELFGHRAGAYTGALKDAKGIFEEAHKGTVFLDEIGEMPLDLQAKLLRVLETGEFLKVGDSKATKVDVRIIAATNRNLKKEIEVNRFREDLYYRISVFQIALPPLRERTEDIEALAAYFVHSVSLKIKKRVSSISRDYLDALRRHEWKGNIRELKNVIERSIILTDSDMLEVDSLPLDFIADSSSGSLPVFSIAGIEKLHIQRVLRHTGGNKAEAARLLEIGIATLYRKIEEYEIR